MQMKKILTGLAAVAGLSVSVLAMTATAHAADLAAAPVYTKAPPPVAIYNWTGFYIGANGGMGEGNTKERFSNGAQANQGLSGGMAGATAGYNWQFGAAVVGVESDWDWTDIKGSAACPNTAFTCFSKANDVATFRGRLGWAANGPVLLYVTGGAAYENVKNGALNAAGTGGLATGSYNTDRWGWAAGAGVEYGFLPNWSAKLEYMHYGFMNYTAPAGTLSTTPTTLSQNIDTIKVGVNYHFNWGGPVVAKY